MVHRARYKRVGLIKAVLTAAELVGNPHKRGRGGVKGYLEWLAVVEPRAFAGLVTQVLPLQGPEDVAEPFNPEKGTQVLAKFIAIANEGNEPGADESCSETPA